MARRAHNKSRLGCRVCKQRKIKCDEGKPACDRCVTTGRQCSYLTDAPDIPTPASSLSVPSRDATHLPTTPQLTPVAHDATTSLHHPDEQPPCLDNPSLTENRFSLAHLQLLDHIRSSMTTSGPIFHYAIERGYKLALRVPYLMDQLLALAAAHKSKVALENGDERLERFFRMEATKLQTRALSGVALARNVMNRENADALYTFSAFLGHHVLFDTFSAREPLSVTLDKLDQCFELNQSIRFTASEALQMGCSMTAGINGADESYMTTSPHKSASGTECAGILQRLRGGDLDQAVADVYCETVNILQYLLDTSQSSASERRVGVVQEWLVRVPYEYLTYLRQRRPEAIVILAHYAVLLHRARDYWAVGEAGRFLIQEIGSYLGGYWADWLVWPQQALEDG
ncbi:unnamed protein product [Fusarium graminearum]|uniref:Zn(2)-C6 fungal-type domain-containing protein n=1 Tax=Gibberella zeae TaxID=5518 RepID=A0A4E9EJU6_GIBZA|nr:unnamed protein product [Fusarium graminearum]